MPDRELVPDAGQFPPTCWSLILAARGRADPRAREALAALCTAYWYPLYAFIRFFHSNQIAPTGVNWSHYRDAGMDRMLDAATTSFDTAEQDAVMRRVHEKAVNEALWVFVAHDTNPHALGRGARGYTPFGTERAKDAQIHDLKEFWHVGRSLPDGHPFAEYMPANVWPGEVADFRETFEALYAAFDAAGRRVLQAVALHLGLAQDYFDDTVRDGNSVMRLLHYPPLTGADAEQVGRLSVDYARRGWALARA